jgi:hypothetical protein
MRHIHRSVVVVVALLVGCTSPATSPAGAPIQSSNHRNAPPSWEELAAQLGWQTSIIERLDVLVVAGPAPTTGPTILERYLAHLKANGWRDKPVTGAEAAEDVPSFSMTLIGPTNERLRFEPLLASVPLAGATIPDGGELTMLVLPTTADVPGSPTIATARGFCPGFTASARWRQLGLPLAGDVVCSDGVLTHATLQTTPERSDAAAAKLARELAKHGWQVVDKDCYRRGEDRVCFGPDHEDAISVTAFRSRH